MISRRDTIPTSCCFSSMTGSRLTPVVDWSRFIMAEPLPFVRNGVLYWKVAVIPEDAAGIAYQAFVDSRTNRVIELRNDDDIRRFIKGELAEQPEEVEKEALIEKLLQKIAELDAGEGFACLDYGRGIWPYSSFWNWASASGVSDGHTIGLNFGAGWTDGTGMTENGICIDGVLSKIGQDVIFEYDRKDFTRPWIIRTAKSDLVALRFEPFFERVAKTDFKVLRSVVHQLIGRFSGSVTDNRGKEIQFENIIGWAEEHQARW